MKKFLSIVVLVCIIASVCSVSAFAANHSVSDQTSLESALSSLVEGDTITLTADINLDKSILFPAACTINAGAYKFILAAGAQLDGKNSTLNSSADRAINVNANGAVSISNLTIKAAGERGINIIQQPANLTLSNVVVNAGNYAINVANSSTGSQINIIAGRFSGLNVLNIHGANTSVTASSATFETTDTSASEGYSNIVVGYDAPGSTVNLNSCTLNYNPNGEGYNFVNETEAPLSNVLRNNNSNVVNAVNQQAIIKYDGGYYYTFSTLADAVDYASDGDTVKLLRDVDLGGQKIPVNKNITIAAAGHKITNGTFVVDPSVASTFDITGLGNPEQLQQLLSGQLPAGGAPAADPNPYGVPSTGSERDTALMIVLAVISGSVLLFSLRRKREA